MTIEQRGAKGQTMTPLEAYLKDTEGLVAQSPKLLSIVSTPIRRIVSDNELDTWEILFPETMNFIKTCHNKQQCGWRDRYLAWADDRNSPPDLEFHDNGTASGSHWSNKP